MAKVCCLLLHERMFVLVVFALLNCIEGIEHINSTEFPESIPQTSTVFIPNELNVTRSFETASTQAPGFNFLDTSIDSSPASGIDTQEPPQSSSTDSDFTSLPGDNELKNVEENSRTDSFQNVAITDTPAMQSTSSSKITWSPGVSINIFYTPDDSSTNSAYSHESASGKVGTTLDIYNSLNHNENELDAEVGYSKMVTDTYSPTSKIMEFYKSLSTLHSVNDLVLDVTSSLLNDTVTFEPPKSTHSGIENTPSSFSVAVEVSEPSSSTVPPGTSTLAYEDNLMNFNNMPEFEKQYTSSNFAESSAQTKSNVGDTTDSYETQKSESSFRHTRSMADFADGSSDFFELNTTEQTSTTQESVTLTDHTEYTELNTTNSISSDSTKQETPSFPLNLTNNESTSSSSKNTTLSLITTSHPIDENVKVQDSETESLIQLPSTPTVKDQGEISTKIENNTSITQSMFPAVTTSHSMEENISVQDSETESPVLLYSITTDKAQEETSTETYTDISPSDPSEIDLKGKSMILNTENDHDISDSTQSQSSSDHSMHIPNVTTTTFLSITAMEDKNATSDSLLKINDLSMLTEATFSLEEHPFSVPPTVSNEGNTNITKEGRGISDIPTDSHSALESVVTAVQSKQTTTSSSLLKTNEYSMETSHSIEEQPSSLPSIIDGTKLMVHTSTTSNLPDEISTIKSVDSDPDTKEILTSFTPDTEITDTVNQTSFQSPLSTDMTHLKLDDTTTATTVRDIHQPTSTSTVEPTTTQNPITFVTQNKVPSTTKETLISSEFESTFFNSGESTSLSSSDGAFDSSTNLHKDPLLLSNQTTPEHQYVSTTPNLSPLPTTNQATTLTIDEMSNTHLPSVPEVNTQDYPTTTSPDGDDISSIEVTTSSSSSKTSAVIHVFPSMLSTSEPSDSTEEINLTSGMESKEGTNFPSSTVSSFDYTSVPTSNPASETHREGKRIPFSTESSRKTTVESSNNVIFISSTPKLDQETTTMSIMEELFEQLYYEDLTSRDQENVITAVVQLPPQDMDNLDIDSKVSVVHNWLTHVLMKEFQNWTKDPFDEIGSNSSDVPFGRISIFYLSPTPNIQSSNITMSFIVHNQWRNDTLPVDFVLSILKFYSKDLKQSMNATLVDFYHGLPIKEMDLIPLIIEKYGALVFITVVVAVGSLIFICILVIYRKRHRRSVHYLSTGKIQHSLPESVGIDLTPDVVILQDEKKILNGNNKICDDEGWLVPIHEVPLAEDCNMPKVQDTKL